MQADLRQGQRLHEQDPRSDGPITSAQALLLVACSFSLTNRTPPKSSRKRQAWVEPAWIKGVHSNKHEFLYKNIDS
jgi:hypothetical protein